METPDQSSAGLVRANVLRHSGAASKGNPMMNQQPLPPIAAQDVSSLMALLQLVADPKAAKQRLDQISTATAEAEKKIALSADADKVRAALDKEVAEKRKAADGALEHTRAEHDQEWNARHTSLIAREKRAEEREADLDRRDREMAQREAALNARDRKFKEAIGAA